MTQRVTRSITIRRDHEDVAAFVTDPQRVLPVIPGFGRFRHVGGRVLVTHPSVHGLEWRSLRGTSHSFAMTVEPLGAHTRLTMTLTDTLTGLLTARLAELVVRGITARHLEAGPEQIRHLLEHELR